MDGLEQALAQYGPAVLPLVIFAGAFSEGHTLVIAGGLFAHQELLSVWLAFGSAFAGSFTADQLLFIAGRSFRDRPFVVRASGSKAGQKAFSFIEKNPTGYILVFRFIYGLRLASPVALGVTKVPALRFTLLNICGALLWAGVFTALGYFFGETIQRMFGHSKRLEHWLIGASIVLVLALALWHVGKWAWEAKTPKETDEAS
jgi:membrane protein DedA with SNARE-associated domain